MTCQHTPVMRLNFLDKPDTNDKLQGKTMNGKQLYERRSSANGEGPHHCSLCQMAAQNTKHAQHKHTHARTHTHRHTHTHPFNGPFSRTTRANQYQKGKTNLDFTEARDSEWQWHQLGRMQVYNSLQTDNHASTSPLSFLQAGCPSCRPTNSVKALKALSTY